ncbi:MAG: ABC transporter ATP-binding protein [Desulfovibrio sp.]|jgi:multiple sugar transport system ATP-binding protein|nr:ABC transporter ATP-binding protein [Desulfovibrio sp.]
MLKCPITTAATTTTTTAASEAYSASGVPVLEARELSKHYGRKTALDRVSFSVPPESFVVILGPAGAGKTTTLRLLAGLERESGGDILMSGESVAGLEPKDRDIAMIFDNLALYPHKTGFQNIAGPLLERKLPREEIKRRVGAVAAKLRIEHVLERLPKTMSGGERQRTALGRALVRSPRVFLLDEPLSSLDAPLRFELRAELKRLQREEGRTFLMATPDFAEALAVADTVLLLRSGKIVQASPPEDLYDYPVDCEAALFVGSPQIAVLHAEFREGLIHCAGLAFPLPTALEEAAEHMLRAGPGGFLLGIRPENVRVLFSSPSAPEAGGWTGIPGARDHAVGQVTDIESLGLRSVITVRCGREQVGMLCSAAQRAQIRIGQDLAFTVADRERLTAFDRVSRRNILRRAGGRVFEL